MSSVRVRSELRSIFIECPEAVRESRQGDMDEGKLVALDLSDPYDKKAIKEDSVYSITSSRVSMQISVRRFCSCYRVHCIWSPLEA